jgi:hypothetical protein
MTDKRSALQPLAAGTALLLTLAAGTARAETSDFDWLGIAYLWASDITVDSRDRSVGLDFNNVLDKLEMAFQGHVEVQGDELGGFMDATFLGLGDNNSRTIGDFHTDLDMTALDLALVWSPGTERMTGLELYGGLRYLDTRFKLVFQPAVPGPTLVTRSSDNFSDLLVGARYSAPLDDRWRLTLAADLSGGETEGTWSAGAFAGYRTGQHHFYAGYRHLEIEVKTGGVRATETFTGPVVAYGYSF